MVTQPVSLNPLAFSLVGPGKVGSSLAYWLVASGCRLSQIAASNLGSAEHLAAALKARAVPLQGLETAADDLLVIAVNDPAIDDVVTTLGELDQARVVLHTSGRFSAGVLATLRRRGSAVGSLHPLRAFPGVLMDPDEAVDTVFGIDGDPAARSLAARIAVSLRGQAIPIPPAVRSQYHLAATLAAGGLVTLLASAAELAQGIGLGPEVVKGYLELARGAVQEAARSEPIAAAITGPVARGDWRGFQGQIDELRDRDPDLAGFLDCLARRTLHHCRQLEDSDSKLPHS